MWWITFVALVVVKVMALRGTEPSLRAGEGVAPSSIGSSFYLPAHSIIDELGQGYKIFSTMPPECVVKHLLNTNTEQLYSFDSAESFYTYAANLVGLKSSQAYPHTFYTSLVAVSESIDTTKMDLIGKVIDITAVSYSYQLNPDCVQSVPLVQSFEGAYKKLPMRVTRPYERSSWEPYKVFLETYGTHYQTSMKYGSRILEYIFAKRSRGYSNVQMMVEICKRFRNVNMALCDGVSKEGYNNDNDGLITSSFFDVRGGNSTTMSALMADITQKDLQDFLQQADQHHQVIKMTVEPIWELLKKRYIGSPDFNKALSLEQYYIGYVAHGCSHVRDNGIDMRMFDVLGDDEDIVEYGCKLYKPGCRKDNDCNLGTMSWSCFCYGFSCVDKASYFNPALGQIQTRAMRRTEQGTTWEGVNLSCHYKFGPGCYCDKPDTQWDVTWPSPSSELKHNLQLYRQLYRTLRSSSRTNTTLSSFLLSSVILLLFWTL